MSSASDPTMMPGWGDPIAWNGTAVVAHWMAFLFLFATTAVLSYYVWFETGPRQCEQHFCGYREQNCLSVYVNMFSCISYFGKVVADMGGQNYKDVGPFVIGLGNYRYADYLLTCPLLVLDLMYQLRAPYKISGAVLMIVVILSGVVTNFYNNKKMKGAALVWFAFGAFWYILAMVFFRKIMYMQYDKLAKLARHSEGKKAMLPLRIAINIFFAVWTVYPILWILERGIGIMDVSTSECLVCFADIITKCLYGISLARFRSYFDKKMFEYLETIGLDGVGPQSQCDMPRLDGCATEDVLSGGPRKRRHVEDSRPEACLSREGESIWPPSRLSFRTDSNREKLQLPPSSPMSRRRSTCCSDIDILEEIQALEVELSRQRRQSKSEIISEVTMRKLEMGLPDSKIEDTKRRLSTSLSRNTETDDIRGGTSPRR